MSEYRCPDCPECGTELTPHKYRDTELNCDNCGYQYDWVEAVSGGLE